MELLARAAIHRLLIHRAELNWLHADLVAVLVQAVEPKWLHHADQVVQLQAVHLAAALKWLPAILVALHPAIADVAQSLASVVCSLRFSSARAAVIPAVTQLQAAALADPLQADAALVAVHLYRHQWLLQWLHQHQWLTHMPI